MFYKDAAAELDKEKSLVKADLAYAQEAYREVKEECMMSKIARSATEKDGKKANGYFKRKQKNPQAHGYRCSFHPGVFQSIDFPQGTSVY